MNTTTGKPTVLLVEDETITALFIRSMLEELGYQVIDTVITGEDAIKRVEDECPDIILMDIVLDGEIDGIEAAEEIRSSHDIPIIFTTASTDRKTLERAKESGPAMFLAKPLKKSELGKILDSIPLKAS